jgi:hypothetical protein
MKKPASSEIDSLDDLFMDEVDTDESSNASQDAIPEMMEYQLLPNVNDLKRKI